MDEFQEKSTEFLAEYAKPMMIGAAALFLVGIGWATINQIQSSNEKSAQEKFAVIERKYQKIKEGFDKAENEAKAKLAGKVDAKDANKPPSGPAKTGDLEKDFGSVTAEFESFITSNSKSGASGLAALTLCQIYQEYKKNDLCLAALEKVSQIDRKQFLGTMIQTRYATALADNNQCPKAREIWTQLGAETSQTFMKQELKLRTALCFEQEGQIDQAKALYTEIGSLRGQHPDDSAIKDADRYLRYLQFKTQGAQVGKN